VFLGSVERSGGWIEADGLVARSPFVGATFTYQWADVTGFSVEPVPGSGRTVVCVELVGKGKVILPTLQVWGFQRKIIEPLCDKLNTELAATRATQAAAE
jgi:hypothetical protein